MRISILLFILFTAPTQFAVFFIENINFMELLQNLQHFCQYRLISITNLIHKFFYSMTICMFHYDPRHVSSINMPIFRRINCIITSSGIVTLCKWLYSVPDESRLLCNTICPPEDGHVNARNMSRIVV